MDGEGRPVVFAGSKDGSIRAWGVNAATGTFGVTAELSGHVRAVTTLLLVEDVLISGSEDRTVRWGSRHARAASDWRGQGVREKMRACCWLGMR